MMSIYVLDDNGNFKLNFILLFSHWKCTRMKRLSTNWQPDKNVLCSHSNSKIQPTPMSKKNTIPEQQQRNVKQTKLKKKKLHTFISIMYYIQIGK